MTYLHINPNNIHKERWIELVKDHPANFEILEWSRIQDRDHVMYEYPSMDLQLFPVVCVDILASMCKLITYGGIVVEGEGTAPIRGVRSVLADWKNFGPPKKLTVKGFSIDPCRIMISNAQDPVATKYRDEIAVKMLDLKWEAPKFGEDVAWM